MKFRVSILPQAQRDIDRNAVWWADHHSVAQALQWSDAVYDQIETLADCPESHGLSTENDDFPFEIRDKLLGLGPRPSDRAVFTIRDDTVYVLTVRRGSQHSVTPDQLARPPQA